MMSKAGIDTLKFEFVLRNPNTGKHLQNRALRNALGMEFGKIDVKGDNVCVVLCLPKCIRQNNVSPFTVDDMDFLESVRNDLYRELQDMLENVSECWLKSVECNITQRVLGASTPSQVLDFIHRSYSDTTNLVYEGASKRCRYIKEKETLIIRRKNYYLIKSYNKTLQQKNEGNHDVESGLLRIEIVMLDRIIRQLFGKKCDIFDVLQEQNLKKVIAEYKRIFTQDMMGKHFTPCMQGITQILIDSLNKTNKPAKTIYQYKEIILDVELLRRALKEWCSSWDVPDNSRQCIYRLKEYHLPSDVIKTIEAFFDCCD